VSTAPTLCRHRYPGELFSYAMWLYYRFTLSYRDVEVLLAERGVQVTYDSVRQWCLQFGPSFRHRMGQRSGALT
jgi:putative transposase